MKININEYPMDFDPLIWSDLLSDISKNRSEKSNSEEKKYVVICKKSENDTTFSLKVLRKNEFTKYHQKLTCAEIVDISSQIFEEQINSINDNTKEKDSSSLDKLLKNYDDTKAIIERSYDLKDKKIKQLDIESNLKFLLLISIIGIPIILFLDWMLKNLNNQKKILSEKFSKFESYQQELSNKIKIQKNGSEGKAELDELEKEKIPIENKSSEKIENEVPITEVEEEEIQAENKATEEIEGKVQFPEIENEKTEAENEEFLNKIIKNLNLNEKLFRENVKAKGLENTEEFQLHQLKSEMEQRDKKVDSIFWDTIDKLIDQKNSLSDRLNLYKSLAILSSKKSIIPLATALKNEKNIDQTKSKLLEVIIKAGNEFQKRILKNEKINPEFFDASSSTYGILIDEEEEMHIIREMFTEGGDKRLHTVTSLHSPDEYIAGISSDERSVKKEQTFLEDYKNKPGFPPTYKIVVKYAAGSQNECVFLQKRFSGDGTLLIGAEPIVQLKALLGALEGLCALHKDKIVHCDFKPNNFLIDSEGNGYITDFGACTLVGEIQTAYTSDYATKMVIKDMNKGKDHVIKSVYEDSYALGITLLNYIDISLFGKDKTPINELSDSKLANLLSKTKKTVKNNNSITKEHKEIHLEMLNIAKKLLVKPKSILQLKLVKGMTCEAALQELRALYKKYTPLIGEKNKVVPL